MRNGLLTHRPDLFDTERPIETVYSVVSTPSSATGCAYPWGSHEVAPRLVTDYVLPVIEPDWDETILVVLDAVQPFGLFDTVLVFAGHTDSEDLLFAVDHRPARQLREYLAEQDELGGEASVEIEPWQVLNRHRRG